MNGGKRPVLFPYIHQYPPTAESLPDVIKESAFPGGVLPTPVDIPELCWICTSKRMRRKKDPLWMKHAPDKMKSFYRQSNIEPPSETKEARRHGQPAASGTNTPTDCERDPNTSQPHAIPADVVVPRSVFARKYSTGGHSCSKCGHVPSGNGVQEAASSDGVQEAASSDAPASAPAPAAAAAAAAAAVARGMIGPPQTKR